jgi:tetratricopeptide (TPR) repeat protein
MLCVAAAAILLGQAPSQGDLFAALKAGRFAEALSIAASLVAADPSNARLRTAQGLAYRGLGRMNEGLTAFEAALKIQPRYLPALEGAAETAYRSGDPKAAVFLKTILEAQPDNQTAHAMSGVLAFESKDCGRAIHHFERSAASIAANHVALSEFGFCLLVAGQPERSADAFARALSVRPSDVVTRFNIGLVQHLAGKHAAAISTLEPLIGSSNFDADVLNLLSAAYAATEHVPEAIEALRKATQLAPCDERHYFDLAVLCMEHQAPQLAIEIATLGLKNIPDSTRLYTVRGAVYGTMNRFEEAQADFEAAERLMPDTLYGSIGLTLLFRQANELDRAIAIVRDKLRQKPADATLNFLLADALLRKEAELGDEALDEVRSALLKAVRSKPDFAKAHAQLAKIYLRDGETEKAVAELRLALKLDPGDRVALHQLSIALHRIGQPEEAHQLAMKLKDLLRQEQANETQRNRFRLLKTPSGRDAPGRPQ